MGKPLLDVLRELTLDPDKQAAFADNPSGYLAQYGYEDVEADHLSEAFSLVADTLPPDVAQAVASTAPVAAVATAETTEAPEIGDGDLDAAFGGLDAGYDTMDLNGSGDGLDADEAGGAGAANHEGVNGADDGDGPEGPDDGDASDAFGTGELSVGDLADDGGLDGNGDTVAFGVGSDDAPDAGPVDDDGGSFALDGLDAGGDAGLVDDALDDATGFDDGLDDALDDALDLGPAGADGAPPDDVDDGPADDVSFDDIGSF